MMANAHVLVKHCGAAGEDAIPDDHVSRIRGSDCCPR
jgi:hypothetical protein